MPLVDALPEEALEPSTVREQDSFADDSQSQEELPAGERFVTVLKAVSPEELLVVKSMLINAGIPFIAKGEGLHDLIEPGRIGTGYSLVLGPLELQVPEGYLEDAREILRPEEEEPDSEERVKELEHSFLSEMTWLAIFFAGGFGLAYVAVPDSWDDGIRFVSYAIAAALAVLVGKAILGSRTEKERED